MPGTQAARAPEQRQAPPSTRRPPRSLDFGSLGILPGVLEAQPTARGLSGDHARLCSFGTRNEKCNQQLPLRGSPLPPWGPGVLSEQGRGVPRWKVPLSLSRSYGEGVCMWPCIDPQGAGTGGEQTRDRGSPENSRWRNESRGAHCASPQAARGRGECPTVCTVFRKPQLSTK